MIHRETQPVESIRFFRILLSNSIIIILILILIVDNDYSKRIDFVLELGIVPLICNHLLKSDKDELLIECAWVIVNLCSGTSTQVMIMNLNEK